MENEKQSQAIPQQGGYGYASDEVKISPFNFGGNFGKTFLTKFEWIANGGKDGAEQEALEIIFNINGTDKSYRQFPTVKAFDKDNNEVTDVNHPAFVEAVSDFNARMTHILHVFMDSEAIKQGFARPISSFKEYAQIAMSMLPKNYKEIPLDIFLQFQWQLKQDQQRTYLDIPSKMKYGRWLVAAVAPVSGDWKKMTVDNPTDDVRQALWYEDGAGNIHPFIKNGWFMNSNFAKQQGAASTNSASPAANSNAAVSQGTVDGSQTNSAAKASAW